VGVPEVHPFRFGSEDNRLSVANVQVLSPLDVFKFQRLSLIPVHPGEQITGPEQKDAQDQDGMCAGRHEKRKRSGKTGS
jgi:hypothetical protein